MDFNLNTDFKISGSFQNPTLEGDIEISDGFINIKNPLIKKILIKKVIALKKNER